MSTTSVECNTTNNTNNRGNNRARLSNNRNTENHTRNQISSQDVRYSQGFNPYVTEQMAWSRSQYQGGYPYNYNFEEQYEYYGPVRGRPNYYHNQNRRYNPQSQRRAQTNRFDQRSQRNNQASTSSKKDSTKQRIINEPENLRSNLIEQLHKNVYECMICINTIQREQSIWSCEICFKMFHLSCIQKWAKSEESSTNQGWRCPGCQYSHSETPSYSCFCEKRENPPYHPNEIPHSCGETCGKQLNKKSSDCRHHCTELCHPGPCPTCNAMVTRTCLCGRESQKVMCSSTNIMKCESPCEKLKSCQHHKCDKICHARECDACDVLIKQYCSSHGIERQVLCSNETGTKDSYTCGQICDKMLSCGHHRCQQACHQGQCQPCALLPENCEKCACGKTIIKNQERTSCTDPLPTCTEICEKRLSCGPANDKHQCSTVCHDGPCPPCNKDTDLRCRCGQNKKLFSCKEAIEYDSFKNPYLCDRRCNKKKICGKHRCNEFCCDRDIHVCEVVCGKKLNCGNHNCEELCHRNACRPCQIVSYDELSCRCGQTIQHPPIPCGTPLPSCHYQCNRTHSCEHPVYHSCHNEQECPPCVYLVSKMCVGGHATRDNIPCHLKEVLCGQMCGKALHCGVHKCQRSCHSGPCLTAGQKCTQRCSVKRRDCGHPCNANCHENAPCPSMTCKEIIHTRCQCGRLEKEFVCNIKPKRDSNNESNDSITQSLLEALSVQTIDLSLTKKHGSNVPQVECDEQCLIIQRNRKLAEALSIDPDGSRLNTVVYTDFLKDYAKKNIDFVISVERDFSQLVEDTQRLRANKRCHTFKPMKKNERHVVHELASFYGLETQSMDPEPQRNVVAYSALGVCKIPQILLSETVRREKTRIPPPITLQ